MYAITRCKDSLLVYSPKRTVPKEAFMIVSDKLIYKVHIFSLVIMIIIRLVLYQVRLNRYSNMFIIDVFSGYQFTYEQLQTVFRIMVLGGCRLYGVSMQYKSLTNHYMLKP